MAFFIEKLRGIVKDDATVLAIVGDKVHIGFAKKDKKPYVTMFVVTGDNIVALDGVRSGKQGPIIVQIDCYARSLQEIHDLARAVRDACTFKDTQAAITVRGMGQSDEFAAAGENALTRHIVMDVQAMCDVALT